MTKGSYGWDCNFCSAHGRGYPARDYAERDAGVHISQNHGKAVVCQHCGKTLGVASTRDEAIKKADRHLERECPKPEPLTACPEPSAHQYRGRSHA